MAVTVQDHNNMSRVERLFDDLRRYALLIGIFGEDDSEMVQIAIWNEFGTSKIPERSFLRAGFDANQSRIEQICEMALDEVLEGVDGSSQFDVASMYDQIGLQVADIIREYLTDLRSPPNAPSTIKLKGSSNPLIDTGHLRSSIVWKVVSS